MEKNSKIIIVFSVFSIIILLGVLGASLYSLSDNIRMDIYLDGENATVKLLAIPFGKDMESMENEIITYSIKEMNNVNSDISSLKFGIMEIARKYGFNDINLHISSQFGEDKLPMRVIVDGISMFPTLLDGEEVIIEKTQNIQVGDIVVAKDPEYKLLIKRVAYISGDKVFLSSDNNDTITIFENGTYYNMIAVEKWTDMSNIVGVARVWSSMN
ncbi:MAG: S24/S26 family peptidase [Methanobrevibacter sp.]|nr:S24/S26 family peptidase [Methanobrevibacter sp.]